MVFSRITERDNNYFKKYTEYYIVYKLGMKISFFNLNYTRTKCSLVYNINHNCFVSVPFHMYFMLKGINDEELRQLNDDWNHLNQFQHQRLVVVPFLAATFNLRTHQTSISTRGIILSACFLYMY